MVEAYLALYECHIPAPRRAREPLDPDQPRR